MLTLFGFTRDPARRMVRFSLDQLIQPEIEEYLNEQVAEFRLRCEDEIPFDGKYKPDDGEVLVIEPFESVDNFAAVILDPLSTPVADPATLDFNDIKALFWGEQDAAGAICVCLQHFDKRRLISTKGLSIFHANNVYKKVEGVGLTLDTKVSAILCGTKLSFCNFFLVRQMLELAEYYKDATNADIEVFAGLPQLKVEDVELLTDMSDSWVRRKIWLVQRSQILETVPINEIAAVAVEFNVPFETELDDAGVMRLKLPDNKADFKKLLRLLDEDYYKSPLSQNRFISNSRRPVVGAE